MLAGLLALTGVAGPANAQVIAPGSPVAGQSQLFWAEQWWAWALPLGSSINPSLDTTGAQGFRGDVGPVFFLAGSFSSAPVSRAVTVPAGKPLIVPLANAYADNTPATGSPPGNLTPSQLLDLLTPFYDPAQTTLTMSINGTPQTGLLAHRQTTLAASPFSVTLPTADNLLTAFGLDPTAGTGVYPVTVTPAVQDGYYVALEPFAVNTTNTIAFTSVDASGFAQNITYTITTVPEPTSLSLVGVVVGGWLIRRAQRRG